MHGSMTIYMISILVLSVLGVASSRTCCNYGNETNQQPIVTKMQEHVICAELCLSGMGGDPCGDECWEVMPEELPEKKTQSQTNNDEEQTYYPRSDVCPVLCDNRLGYPLCNCNYTEVSTPFFRINFLQICTTFCEIYDYRLHGCDSCHVYKNMSNEKVGIVAISAQLTKKSYDLNAWCKQKCSDGDGGAACYCDLLPMALKVEDDP